MSIYGGIFNATKNPEQLNSRSFAGTMLRRTPNGSAPLFGMTAMTGRSQAVSSTHGYFSKTLEFSRVQTNGAALAADTTITVDTSAGIVKGQVLLNWATGENLRVTGVVSGTQLAVTRGFGRIAAANIADNTPLVVIGTAYEEGSARPQARSIQPIYVPNFTQIFRNAWALTDTARASLAEMKYSNIAENKRDCMIFHSMDIESAIFFGQPKMDTSGSQPIHATQGIIDAIRQYAPGNIQAAGATTSYDDFVDLVMPAYTYSTDVGDPTVRVIFGDTQAVRVLNDIGREFGEVTLTQKETSYGLTYDEMKFFKGRVLVKEHPLFNGLQVAPGLAVVVDVPAVKLAYMAGRDAMEETYGVGGTNQDGSVTNAGVDAQGGSLTSELAVELINPTGCAVITGLTAAAPRTINVYQTNYVAP